MKYAILGDSSLRVSKIGLGTMNFGAVCDEAESHRILDAYTAQGGARSADHIADLLGNPDLELSDEEFAAIDALS